jgi:hypothetical protein
MHKKIVLVLLLMIACISSIEVKAEETNRSGIKWLLRQKKVDGDLIRERLKNLIEQEDSRRDIFIRSGMASINTNEEFFKVFFGNNQEEMILYVDGLTYQFKTRIFEGLGGPNIPNDDGFGNREFNEYGMCRGILKFIDESNVNQLTLTGICDDFCDYRLSLKCNGNFIDFDLKINNRTLDEKTYWFDDCFMFPEELLNSQTEVYYFNPDPVLIENIPKKDAHGADITCFYVAYRKDVDYFWTRIKTADNKKPLGTILVYNRDKDLGVIITWEDTAILGVNFNTCVHVNPSFSFLDDKEQVLRGKIGVLRGDLESMHNYITDNCY